MKVLGPFRELDADQDYRLITLMNGVTALLISTEKKDTPVRRATAHLKEDDRKAVVKLLRELSGTASTPSWDTNRHRRSTLLTEARGENLQSILRTSQHRLNGIPSSSFKGEHELDIGENQQARFRSRTSLRNADDSSRIKAGQRLDETQGRTSTFGGRIAQIKEEDEVVNTDSVTNIGANDDVEERLSLGSRKSLPAGNSGRRNHSQRMTSVVGTSLLSSPGSAVFEESLPMLSDFAAAALCVNVGSLSDPADCQGQAHVLEHMIFMGNEFYPNENDWDTFLASAGGDSNATTEPERTIYHFTVPQESFSLALTRFACLFRNPLLRKESLQRELAAIDSEFNDSAGDLSFRLAEVACATARTGPFSQFACGNSKSLKSNPELHSCLLDFFNAHYIASNMTVVLYSADSLDDLEALCKQEFGMIPTVRSEPTRPMLRFIPSLPPFCGLDHYGDNMESSQVPGEDGYTLGCIVLCDPGETYPHTLQLSWQLPSQRSKWASKPLLYISHIVNSEANGSVLQELRLRGWACRLSASDGTYASGIEGNSISTLFSISIILTDLGLQHWEQVAALVFEYLGMMANNGVQKWAFDELSECLLAQYIIQDASAPGSVVETLCRRLCTVVSEIPPERVCNGENLLFEYEPNAIIELIRLLVPESCRVDLITQVCDFHNTVTSNMNTESNGFLPDWMLGKVSLRKRVVDPLTKDAVVRNEPWYQTPYCVVPIPRKTLSKWRDSLRATKTFTRLPNANIFISSQSLNKQPRVSSMTTLRRPAITVDGRECIELEQWGGWSLVAFSDPEQSYVKSSYLTQLESVKLLDASRSKRVPAMIEHDSEESNFCRIWLLQHTSFEHSSRVTILFSVRYRPGSFTALQSALLDLLLKCWEDSIIEDRYAAELTGTRLEVRTGEARGFTISFSGLISSVLLLIERTLPTLFDCAEHGIKHIKNISLDMQLQYILNRFANDESSLKETLDSVLRVEDHHPLTKLKSLESVGQLKKRLDAFSREFFSDCRVVGIALGKIDVESLASIATSFSRKIAQSNDGHVPWEKYFKGSDILKIPPNQTLNDSTDSLRLYLAPVRSSSVLMYLQLFSAPAESLKEDAVWKQRKDARVMMQLIAQLMREPFFNTLRTKWQIAYHAHASSYECGPSDFGITIEVSSHHTTSFELVELLDEFLLHFYDTVLEPMPLVDFNRHLRALELRKLEKDPGPGEEARRYGKALHHGLASGRFDWNADSSEVELVGELRKSDVIEYFRRFIHPSSDDRRVIALLIIGEEELAQNGEDDARKVLQDSRWVQRKATHVISGFVLDEDDGDERLDESKTQSSQVYATDSKRKWWRTGEFLRKLAGSS